MGYVYFRMPLNLNTFPASGTNQHVVPHRFNSACICVGFFFKKSMFFTFWRRLHTNAKSTPPCFFAPPPPPPVFYGNSTDSESNQKKAGGNFIRQNTTRWKKEIQSQTCVQKQHERQGKSCSRGNVSTSCIRAQVQGFEGGRGERWMW